MTLKYRIALLIPPIRRLVQERDRLAGEHAALLDRHAQLLDDGQIQQQALAVARSEADEAAGLRSQLRLATEEVTLATETLTVTEAALDDARVCLAAARSDLRSAGKVLERVQTELDTATAELAIHRSVAVVASPIVPGDLESDDVRLAVLQVPKTGGTSLSHLLYDAYGPGEIITGFHAMGADCLGHFDRVEMENFVRSMTAPALAASKIFLGHIPYGFDRALWHRFKYVSFFRQPVERCISGFLYGNATLGWDEEQLLAALHISVSAGGSCGFDNPLTRIISGSEILAPSQAPSGIQSVPQVTSRDAEVAIRHLQRDFGFIGIAERFDASCRMLFAELGKPYRADDGRHNETSISLARTSIPPYTLSLIERAHRHDIEVYNAGVALYNLQAVARGEPLAEPYERRTPVFGPYSSSDSSHIVTAHHAFGEEHDGAWVPAERTSAGEPEYIGYDFPAPECPRSVHLQMAYPSAEEVIYVLEASDDEFRADIRGITQITSPGNEDRTQIVLPRHGVHALYWRLRRVDPSLAPAAIAALSFNDVSLPRRDIHAVRRRIDTSKGIFAKT